MRRSRISRQLSPADARSEGQRAAKLLKPASLTLAGGLLVALAVPALAQSGSPARSAGNAAVTSPPAPAPAASQASVPAVTLVTGQRVRLTPAPSGRSAISVLPSAGSGPRTFMDTFRVNGDVYAIPGYALPYLGSRLDPRLFDVSYLRRAGYAGLRALPVEITWQRQSHPPVPGLAAPASGRRTSGEIPLGSAARFGAVLSASFAAAAGRAETAGARGPLPASGALAEVKQISLAPLSAGGAVRGGAPAAGPTGPAAAAGTAAAPAPAVPLTAPAQPGAKLYTLTVNTIGRNGKPEYAQVYIQDQRHFQRYYSADWVNAGQPLAVSVPAGRYAVEAVIFHLWQGGLPQYMTFVPAQVTVAHDDTITLDARKAKPINVSVPQPTQTEMAGMSFTRYSADGRGMEGLLWTAGPGMASFLPPVRLYATPSPAPATGSLGFADDWELVQPGTGTGGGSPGPQYTYNLDFASNSGVPAVLSHTLTAADLATVTDSFADSVTGTTMQSFAIPFHRWSGLSFALSPTFDVFPAPIQRTDYFGGSATTVWDQEAQTVPADMSASSPMIFGPYRTFHPGEHISATWGAGPAVPAPEWEQHGLPAASPPLVEQQPILFQENGPTKTWSYICPVCREGNVMSFNIPFSGDSDVTHTESMWGMGSNILGNPAGAPADRLTFYRNGAAAQLAAMSGQVFPMLPGRASYRIDWTHVIQAAVWTDLGTTVRSVWTFTSAPARPSHLPHYELCAPDAFAACSFLPLVFANYQFGANLQGQVHAPGTETFTVTGYHELGLTGPAITKATAQVSFDDGKTWSAASVTSVGGGKFQVTFAQPDPSTTSGYASVKVTLTDSAGDSLQQTIIRAYALTSSATSAGLARGASK